MWQNNRIIARIISLILCFSLLLDLTPPVAWASYDDSEEIVSELEIAPEESTELEPDMEIIEEAAPLLQPAECLPVESTEESAPELEDASAFSAPGEVLLLEETGVTGFLQGENEKYNIMILANEHGTIECVNGNRALAGTDVQLTVTPIQGYVFDFWDVYYTDNEGKHQIEVSELDIFRMPAADVTVDARFRQRIILTVKLVWDDNELFTHSDTKVRLEKKNENGQWMPSGKVAWPGASNNWTATVTVGDNPDAYRFVECYNGNQVVVSGETAPFPVSALDGDYQCTYAVSSVTAGNDTTIKNTIRTKSYFFQVDWSGDPAVKASPITAVLQKKSNTDGLWKTEATQDATDSSNWAVIFTAVPDLVDAYRIRARNGNGELILLPNDEGYSGTKASFDSDTYRSVAYNETNDGTTLTLGDPETQKTLNVSLVWVDCDWCTLDNTVVSVELQRRKKDGGVWTKAETKELSQAQQWQTSFTFFPAADEEYRVV